jgi:hypothetical protein
MGARPRFRSSVDPAPASDDFLHMGGGAGAPYTEQACFGLWRCHARQRSDPAVGQFATRESLTEEREVAEGAGDAHALACRSRIEADAPGEPVGAGKEAVAPAAAGVELADHREQARGGRFDVRGKNRDLVAQALEFEGAVVDHGQVRRGVGHGESP